VLTAELCSNNLTIQSRGTTIVPMFLPLSQALNPMRFFLAIGFLVSLSASAASTAPSLAGIWKSDRSLSIAFAERNNKLLPKTRHFWAEMVGRLTVTVTGNSIRSELPPWDIKIEGTAHHMDGFSNTSSYKVVYSDPKTVVVVAENPVTLAPEPTTYNFVGSDTFWIYTGRGDDESPGSHLREYFRRVRQ
jgi:hypothetical protein